MRKAGLIRWGMVALLAAGGACGFTEAAPTVVTVDSQAQRQEFQGMGCGAIFYEAHITSLGVNGKSKEQEQLYDAMFTDVRTNFLQLMIRHDHEPQNDNDDPYKQEFREVDFDYCKHPAAIAAAAKKRIPQMKLYAVFYSPPGWMKTNGSEAGGGEARGTLKEGLELELAEYIWAFLVHMHQQKQSIDYLSIGNEPDWPHEQPSYFLTTERHVALFSQVAGYLKEMHKRFPDVPQAKLVAPNSLSAVDAGKVLVPALLKAANEEVDVIASHDYDRRGDRWKTLRALAGDRPLWQSECSYNAHDPSPGLIRSASEYWLYMTEAFNDGVNVWHAYDWVYPPRQGGEALLHVDWGQAFHYTKIYHGFRQWCAPLEPGMRVVDSRVEGPAASGYSQAGVKASAFLKPDGSKLVVHVAAVQDAAVDVEIRVDKAFDNAVYRQWCTSEKEDIVVLPQGRAQQGVIRMSLPGRGLWTVELRR